MASDSIAARMTPFGSLAPLQAQDVIALLSSELRRKYLKAVVDGSPLSASKLAKIFDISLGQSSSVCRELARHGLIEVVEELAVRGATERMYSANTAITCHPLIQAMLAATPSGLSPAP